MATHLCSHGNDSSCLEHGPCAGRVDGFPPNAKRKLRPEVDGTYTDLDDGTRLKVRKTSSGAVLAESHVADAEEDGMRVFWPGRDIHEVLRI